MLGREEVGDAVKRLVVDEDGAEQRLLGLDVVRRKAEALLVRRMEEGAQRWNQPWCCECLAGALNGSLTQWRRRASRGGDKVPALWAADISVDNTGKVTVGNGSCLRRGGSVAGSGQPASRSSAAMIRSGEIGVALLRRQAGEGEGVDLRAARMASSARWRPRRVSETSALRRLLVVGGAGNQPVALHAVERIGHCGLLDSGPDRERLLREQVLLRAGRRTPASARRCRPPGGARCGARTAAPPNW